jgi:hydrogenase expression/formation protein HypC
MCIGVPGKVVKITRQDDLKMGKVDFDGLVKEVCLALVPEAKPGDYVMVHVGFAIARLNPQEAEESKRLIDEVLGYEHQNQAGAW